MIFYVKITEKLERIVQIEADSLAEAEEIAEEKWNDEEFVLSEANFKGAYLNAQK